MNTSVIGSSAILPVNLARGDPWENPNPKPLLCTGGLSASPICSILLVGYPTKECQMSPVSEYDAKIDVKKRLTLRGAQYGHYHVKEFQDGRIVLEPRELVRPFTVSRRDSQDDG